MTDDSSDKELLLTRIKQLEADLERTQTHAMHMIQSNNQLHSTASMYLQEVQDRDMKIENLKVLVSWYELELAKLRGT